MTGGEALGLMLAAIGVSQASFASDVDISAKHLNQLVKGHVNLTPELAVVIADALAQRLVFIDTKYRMDTVRKGSSR
jgi:plasmid maintenance system antidote protein VapI